MENNGDKQAFPILDPNGSFWEAGLTKREYFAAFAMQGILTRYVNNSITDDVIIRSAEKGLKCADELLKQLSKS